MIGESAPSDAQAARFAAVLDQGDFRAELDRLCVSEWHWGTPQEVRRQPLKWHRERCTFEVAVKTESEWHRVIGKVYEVDQAGIFQRREAVWHAGFGPGAEFAIPRPLAYLRRWRVLLEEKIEGPSAKELLLSGSQGERLAVAERCGGWLARFHATAPRLVNMMDIRDQFPRFKQWAGQVASFGEPFVSKGALLYGRLEAAAPETVEPCTGHGSYIPEHVLLSGERTVTIDLDECTMADPARDVAWFIVSLQRLALVHLGSLHALDGAAEHFLRTYISSGRDGAAGHVPFYRALECLHRARRDLVKRVPPVPEWAEVMLNEGLRALEGVRGRR